MLGIIATELKPSDHKKHQLLAITLPCTKGKRKFIKALYYISSIIFASTGCSDELLFITPSAKVKDRIVSLYKLYIRPIISQ